MMILTNGKSQTLGEFLADRERLGDVKDGFKVRRFDGLSVVSWR